MPESFPIPSWMSPCQRAAKKRDAAERARREPRTLGELRHERGQRIAVPALEERPGDAHVLAGATEPRIPEPGLREEPHLVALGEDAEEPVRPDARPDPRGKPDARRDGDDPHARTAPVASASR